MPTETGRSAAPETKEDVFHIRDCALIAIATGTSATTVRELRDAIQLIHVGSIYHHFWGALLHPRFEEREYNNDFAAWVRHALHDTILAERLAIIDPTEFESLEALRRELVEVIEERLDEGGASPWLVASQPFQFIRSQIVVFDTRTRLAEPRALAQSMPRLSTGTIFYHFIDARRRSSTRLDDFSAWLSACGEQFADLTRQLDEVDPYFLSLIELRRKLASVFADYFGEEA